MKIRGEVFIAALCTFAAVHAAEPTIEFAGVLTNEGHTKLALTNKATGATRWVEPGEVFMGYTVARYDAEHDAVFLRKGGEEMRVSLLAAKAPTDAAASTAATAAPAPSAEAAANAIRGNLRLLAAAARRYQAEHGASTVTYTDLVGPDKPIKELRPIAGETYSNLTFTPAGGPISVTMANGAPVSVDLAPAMPTTAPTGIVAQTGVATPPTTQPAQPAQATPAPAPTTIINITPPAPPAPAPSSEAAATASATEPAASGTSSDNLEPTGRTPAATSYTVSGVNETWESISQKTGVPVTKLKELNSPIPTGSSLPSGQTIRLR
jgi:hypothetical protein